ncbi:MAG: HAD family hydrolase [Hominenteromicrobium sp.]
MQYDGILFDLDGTLWDSSLEIQKSWGDVLAMQPDIPRLPTKAELESVMGLGAEELTEKLFPYLPLERRLEIFNLCAEYECDYLSEHGARLYPHVEETLALLSETHPLFIISNCADGYIQSFLKAHHMAAFIRDFECIGRTGKPKSENIRLITERHHLQHPVYVGDTQWDCDAAAAAGVPFIFAAYGFGHVENTPAISSIAELPGLV